MRRSWLLVVAVISCKSAAEPAESEELANASVTCKPAAAVPVEDVVEVTGVIAPPPKLDAIVSSPVAGRVSRVAVEEGDVVVAGALLATIDDPALPAGADEARAGVAASQAAKVAADQDVARQQRLVETGIGARRDLDEARARLAAANAELSVAHTRAGLASKNNARRELRAPHAGVVLHVWKRVGESVDGTTTTPVAEVADTSTLELRGQLSAAALATIQDGMVAHVYVQGIEAPFDATVARVSPAVDPATLLGTVRIHITAKQKLTVGGAATGQIVIATRPGVVVPTSAVRRSMVGSDEVVVCDKGVARVRPVTVGLRREATIEIAKGLAAGDEVVIDHVLGLEDGQALTTPAGPK